MSLYRVERVGTNWRVYYVDEFQGTTFTKTVAIFSKVNGRWMMHIDTSGMWWPIETCREITALFEELKENDSLAPREKLKEKS